ncbi:WD domain-containing protein [Purpureocillium lavendulum]|uniref:Pre-rRNA-processing protein IPI3 n=1 Tax=Purpureocillium lavendulum TaxID=1247861 RepID=A0AB34G8T5_9HYPO|nr:WD domain-containing protein [Purpureocillium lavendulum]
MPRVIVCYFVLRSGIFFRTPSLGPYSYGAVLTASSHPPSDSLTFNSNPVTHSPARRHTRTCVVAAMLSEELVSAISGPPVAANTAVSKDVGIYVHTVTPTWAAKTSFKKSSAPRHSLAVSDTHVFAAQDQKAHVHVYSRQRGNQDALIPFQERIGCVALASDVLVLGTAQGRLILWEAVSCLAVTPYHVLSASDDSNVNVWSLARLLELGADPGHEPDLTLSNHRAAITDLVVGPSTNAETSLCVSASKDKTCILWNYRTGQVLRTLLFPAAPLCVALDPCARSVFVTTDDRSFYLVELFGDKPLLGSRSAELASIVVQVDSPLGVADEDAGVASCLAVNYDGTSVFTGHAKGKILRWSLVDNSYPSEMANLNASVSNLVFIPPIAENKLTRPATVVKPNQTQRQYTFTAQLEGDLGDSHFRSILSSTGVEGRTLENAIASLSGVAAQSKDGVTIQ